MNLSQTRQQLPVYQRKAEILRVLRQHQVVVISGETGSGKTTQLPQFCLEIGQGQNGKLIGHTQPRRLAARSVAQRIAEEQGTKLGQKVGYQVRFTDQVSKSTQIKLMTDGILLAEIRSDPRLEKYDTIIVDEAHERSLNIDFILGFLAQLLPKRPDLKVVITSATIDSDRFADHFSKALGGIEVPVLEVSGRTYPVEIRYRPLTTSWEQNIGPDLEKESNPKRPDSSEQSTRADEPDKSEQQNRSEPNTQPRLSQKVRLTHNPDPESPADLEGNPIDQITGICRAVDELLAEDPGDILVFLAGERDIRDTEQALAEHLGRRFTKAGEISKTPGAVEVVPLYARLSNAEQQVVFQPHPYTRIVLATNVAETSLTVPGIKYVIDPGLARISRYSNRTKVQRLPIENISQASANQRSGRCGRVSSGIAIRLYSQDDFNDRPQFTEPEILRTSLASVILSMASLRLGKVADFPFLDAPDPKAVADGEQLLFELGALQSQQNPRGKDRTEKNQNVNNYRLTRLGNRLAAFPIDPRLARMIIAADDNGCINEVLVIVAALSMQDVRLRPLEKQQFADQLHNRFLNPDSDFLTYLNLWRYLRTMQKELSGRGFRRLCQEEFLHYLRTREWQDLVGQLRRLANDLGITVRSLDRPHPAEYRGSLQPYHQGLIDACCRLTQRADTDAIHRSLLSGMLSHLGNWDLRSKLYKGARNTQFTIWPGSALADRTFDWVMAHELVETSRVFARSVAKINPDWIEEDAAHLLKHSYGDIFWSEAKEQAQIYERITLFGLTIAADRPRSLASLPVKSLPNLEKQSLPPAISQIFTQPFLSAKETSTPITPGDLAHLFFLYYEFVLEQGSANFPFQRRNQKAWKNAEELEKRTRQAGILPSDFDLLDFYYQRVDSSVTNLSTFARWWRQNKNQKLLDFPTDFLFGRGKYQRSAAKRSAFLNWTSGKHWQNLLGDQLSQPISITEPASPSTVDVSQLNDLGLPDCWHYHDLSLPLTYRYCPGQKQDGVTATITLPQLMRLRPERFQWLVPGMWPDLFAALLKGLPKMVRRQLGPAPELALQISNWICDYCAKPQPISPQKTTPAQAKQANELADSLARLQQWAAQSGNPTSNQKPATRVTASASALKNKETIQRLKNDPEEYRPAWDRSAQTIPPHRLSQVFRLAIDHLTAVNISEADYDHAWKTLPVHLRMHFRIRVGKNWFYDDDLAHLQSKFAKPAQQASKNSLHLALAQVQAQQAPHHFDQQPTQQAFYQSERTAVGGEKITPSANSHFPITGKPAAGQKTTHSTSSVSKTTDLKSRTLTSQIQKYFFTNLSDWPATLSGKPLPDPLFCQSGNQQARLYPAFHPTYLPAPGGLNLLTGESFPQTEQAQNDRYCALSLDQRSRANKNANKPTNQSQNKKLVSSAEEESLVLPYPGSFPAWSAPLALNQEDPWGPLCLRLWARADWAARLHNWGIAQLLTKQLSLSPGRISSRWSSKLSLQLSQAPYSRPTVLINALQANATLDLLAKEQVDTWQVRSEANVLALSQKLRDQFEDQVYQQAQLCAKICQIASEIQKLLDGSWPLNALATVKSVQHSLQRLFYPGFLRDYQAYLSDLPRYLQALQRRLEKIRQTKDTTWDQDRQAQWDATQVLWQQAQDRLLKIPELGRTLHQVDCLYQGQIWQWEWLVSLFAQDLGTKQKVSYQRISKMLQQL